MTTRAAQIEVLLDPLTDPTTGSLCSGYSAYFYAAGTSTPKNVWTEKEKSNPFTSYQLDSGGKALLYGDGIYKIVVKNLNAAIVLTLDNIKVQATTFSVRSVVGTVTVTPDDDVVICDGTFTVNFDDVATFEHPIFIVPTSGSTTTLNPYSTQTINGSATLATTHPLILFADASGGLWRTDYTSLTADDITFSTIYSGGTDRSLRSKVADVVSIMDFGAVADGVYRTNGAITNGDTTLTCTTGIFTAGDVGKLIKVGKAGAAGATLITTIASVTSGTEVELSDAAGATITHDNFTYGTDNATALSSAKTYCWANGLPALEFPDGRYCFSGSLEFAKSGWTVKAAGSNVWLESFRATSGPAVSLNGLTHDATYGVYRFDFGGEYPFNIRGNSNCSSVLYYNNIHFSSINANLRDGNIGIKGDHVLGGGTAGAGAAVDTDFKIRIAHHELDIFDTIPAVGWYMTQTYACRIRMQVEASGDQAGNFGVYMITSNGNTFYGGTVESCNYGGVWVTSTCSRNTFIGTHNEVNGAGPDWKIDGNYNNLIGCAGAATYSGLGTAANLITGDYNYIIGGEFNDLEITVDADYTRVIGANLATGVITNNSITSTFESCNGVVDKAPIPVTNALSLGAGIADTGGSYPPARYFRSRAGMAQVVGVVTMSTVSGHPTTVGTLPADYYPSTWFHYTAFNITTSTVIALYIDTAGAIKTLAAVATNDVISINSPPYRPSS